MTEVIFHPSFIVFSLCTLINLCLFIFLFGKFSFFKKPAKSIPVFPPVSVIITAKNEDENLRNYLPSILEQEYPVFEVIIVNDQSEDDTRFVLGDFEKQYPHLKVVTIKDYINDFPGKKLAITLAIKKSTNNLLVFTDADCKPASNQWLKHIATDFDEHTDIVIGYSPYIKKNSLLNLFIQFDTFYNALQYFSFCLAGMPYMGVGRNMAYKKELFMKYGFSSHLHIPYGDDDLFINKTATRDNVKIEIDPESFVYSLPKGSYYKWKRQKTRHLKAGKEYKKQHKRWLGFVWLIQLMFYLSFLVTLFFFPTHYMLWSVFALRMMVAIFYYGKSLQLLRNINLIWFIPFIEAFYLLFLLPDFSLTAATSRRNAW